MEIIAILIMGTIGLLLLYFGVKYILYYLLGATFDAIDWIKDWWKDPSGGSKTDKLIIPWMVLWVGLILVGASTGCNTLTVIGIAVTVIGIIVFSFN